GREKLNLTFGTDEEECRGADRDKGRRAERQSQRSRSHVVFTASLTQRSRPDRRRVSYAPRARDRDVPPNLASTWIKSAHDCSTRGRGRTDTDGSGAGIRRRSHAAVPPADRRAAGAPSTHAGALQ